MKRPCDQAKLFFLALLRSTAALATESSKLGTSTTMSSVKIFPTTASSSSSSSAASIAASASVASSSTASSTTSRWIQLRLARRTDVPSLQRCNLATLPENYNSQFYLNHLRMWPDLALVCEALPLNFNSDDAPPPTTTTLQSGNTNNNSNNKLTALWGGASRPFQPEPNIVAYVLGKIEEDEDAYFYDDDDDDDDEQQVQTPDGDEWIENDDAYYAAWSKPALLRFRNANPSHRALSSSKSLLSRQEEEDLIQELSSSSSSRRASSNARSQQQQRRPRPRRRRHRLRGHVTSLAVLPEYRRLGLAAALMKQLHNHLTTTTSFNLEHPIQAYYHDDDSDDDVDDDSHGWVNPTRHRGSATSRNQNKVGDDNNNKNSKITRVGLHVRKSNTAACALYQRDGYEVTRVISNYYQDGEDAFYMTKALGTAAATTADNDANHNEQSTSTSTESNSSRRNDSNKSTQKPQQQRLWGRGTQRWRVSSPQDRKEQQASRQVQAESSSKKAASTATAIDEFQLPRFMDLELERQEYLRHKEASASAAAAAASSRSSSHKAPVVEHHDSDEEPELLTGTM